MEGLKELIEQLLRIKDLEEKIKKEPLSILDHRRIM